MSKIVIFPGLGLEFELNPIAFSVFGWDVHWYGVIIACGFLLAVALLLLAGASVRSGPGKTDRHAVFRCPPVHHRRPGLLCDF